MPHEPVDHRAQQRLLELAYDLLTEEEAQPLRERIAADPQWAAAFAQTQRWMAELGEAARLRPPHQEYLAPGRRGSRSKNGAGSRRPAANRWHRGARWGIGFAATALLVMSVLAYLLQRQQMADLAAEHLRLVISGPAQAHAGTTTYYSVSTSTVDGAPLPTQVEFAVSAADSPGGRALLRQKEQSDREGHLQLAIPAEMHATAGLLLEVRASHQQRHQRVTAHIPVAPVQHRTQVTLDRAVYEAGQTVLIRSLTLSRFGLSVQREFPLEFRLEDSGHRPLPAGPISGTTRRGVGAGRIELPADLRPADYRVVARSPDGGFPEATASFRVVPSIAADVVRDAGTAAPAPLPSRPPEQEPSAGLRGKSPAKPLTPWSASVQFFPEGGLLVPGLPNYVYLQTVDARRRPVAIQGRIVDDEGRDHGSLETNDQGRTRFRFTPATGRRYRLQVTHPAGAVEEPLLPEASVTQPVTLHATAGVSDAGKPVEVEIFAARAGMPLVLAATCRGVNVGQQLLVTKAGANEVTLPLPSAVGGLVELTVYGYDQHPPRLLAGRTIFRRPERRLRVHIPPHSRPHTPGGKVAVVATVTNEKGESVPAVLGVSVARSELLAATSHAERLSAALWGDDEASPVDLTSQEIAALLGSGTPSDANIDLLLGSRSWSPLPGPAGPTAGSSDAPAVDAGAAPVAPAVYDNLSELQTTYQRSLEAYRTRQNRFLDTLATLGFFGGFGLLLVVTLLSLLGMTAGIFNWLPAVSAAACCVVLGAILLNPDRLTAPHGSPGGFTSHQFRVADTPPLTGDDSTAAADASAAAAGPLAPASGVAAGGPSAGAAADPGTRSTGEAAGGPQGSAFSLHGFTYVAPREEDRAATPPVLFWSPALVAGTDGRLRSEFTLPDSPGSYTVRIEAAGDGRVGFASDRIVAQLPFTITPQIPDELSASDFVSVPLEIASGTDQPQTLEIQWKTDRLFKEVGSGPQTLELAAGQRRRELLTLETVGLGGPGEVSVQASLGDYVEQVRRTVRVVPTGFPHQRVLSGVVRQRAEFALDVPRDIVPGSLAGRLVLFPSVAAELHEAIEAARRQPRRGVEQLAGRAGILGMALNELADSGLGDSLAARQRRQELAEVLQQLQAHRAPGGGFSCFPGGEPDLALSAWVVLQLPSLARLGAAAPALVRESADWLWEHRVNPESSRNATQPNPATSAAPADIVDAAVTWALAEADHPRAAGEIERIVQRGETSDDPYLVAIAGLVIPSHRTAQLTSLMKRLQGHQAAEGYVAARRATLTASRGPELTLQTTALAILAWNRSAAHRRAADEAHAWMLGQRAVTGGFGSTAATNLALRAVVLQARHASDRGKGGRATLRRHKDVLEAGELRSGQRDALELQQWGSQLDAGGNPLVLDVGPDNELPYRLELSYHGRSPATVADAPLALDVRLGAGTVRRGQSVQLVVELTNRQKQVQPMVLATVGLPAVLQVAQADLDGLVKRGVIDAYESRGRQLIVYWRSVPPQKKITLELPTQARWAGRFTGPASEAYPYHSEPSRCWTAPLSLDVLESQP